MTKIEENLRAAVRATDLMIAAEWIGMRMGYGEVPAWMVKRIEEERSVLSDYLVEYGLVDDSEYFERDFSREIMDACSIAEFGRHGGPAIFRDGEICWLNRTAPVVIFENRPRITARARDVRVRLDGPKHGDLGLLSDVKPMVRRIDWVMSRHDVWGRDAFVDEYGTMTVTVFIQDGAKASIVDRVARATARYMHARSSTVKRVGPGVVMFMNVAGATGPWGVASAAIGGTSVAMRPSGWWVPGGDDR